MNGDRPWRAHLRASLASLQIYDAPARPARARLHANECPEPWPLEVTDAVAEVVREVELGRYPDTSGRELRELLASRHGCDPARLVLGNGSDEVISLLLTALSGSAGAVVVPTPTFVMYGHSARVLGMQVREIAVDDALQLRPEAMRAALRGAAACFLARPNNPTGALWDAELIGALVAEHPATVFVIDEAYAAYAPGSSLWRADAPSNYAFMGTLSKVGLAALRVGYCIVDPLLAEALNKVRHPYNLSRTSLAIAQLVLGRFADVQAGMIARAIENRGRLAEMLAQLPGARVYPSAANLVLVRLASSDHARSLVEHLERADVLVKDVSGAPGLAGCVRVTVGTSEELDVLERELRSWRGQR